MTVYDTYSTLLLTPTPTTALIVGYLRVRAFAPTLAARVPLFDELTPDVATRSPYPLYALVAITNRADRKPRWRLMPAQHHPGRPACLRLHADGARTGHKATISEPVYAALHLPADTDVPVYVAVHARAT